MVRGNASQLATMLFGTGCYCVNGDSFTPWASFLSTSLSTLSVKVHIGGLKVSTSLFTANVYFWLCVCACLCACCVYMLRLHLCMCMSCVCM